MTHFVWFTLYSNHQIRGALINPDGMNKMKGCTAATAKCATGKESSVTRTCMWRLNSKTNSRGIELDDGTYSDNFISTA